MKLGPLSTRTDLVFPDKSVGSEAARFAEGLVLTEWKVAADAGQAATRFKEAKAQAERYSCGLLAGVELAGYRYLIVITRKQVDVPIDSRDGSVTYRQINIAVDPATPSKYKP